MRLGKGKSMTEAIMVGDHVKYREDRPSPDVRNIGKVGTVVDPGILPPFPSHVWVEFPGEPEKAVDRGALLKIDPAGEIAAEDLNASNDE